MVDQKTVLVVDDDQTLLASLVDILRLSGYHVLVATDGSQGLEVLEDQTSDLIVSDIAMPVMDGYQFYEAVRSNPEWTRIPFIFLTARGDQKDIRLGYSLGADQYLTKPFEPEDLLVAIESRLRRATEVQAAATKEVAQTREQLAALFKSELQAPLNSMYGHISMLEEGHRFMTDDVMDRVLRNARNGTEYLIKVVEDMMLLAQIDGGLIKLEVERYRKPTPLGPLLENVANELRPRADAKEISITYAPANFSVLGMPSYVQAILTRLIENAIKFGPHSGHVEVKAEQKGDAVAIVVQDDGNGLEPELLANLFDPRARIDSEGSGIQHVGLGLAIAKGLVAAHGGDIQVENLPGKGVTFTVALPAP